MTFTKKIKIFLRLRKEQFFETYWTNFLLSLTLLAISKSRLLLNTKTNVYFTSKIYLLTQSPWIKRVIAKYIKDHLEYFHDISDFKSQYTEFDNERTIFLKKKYSEKEKGLLYVNFTETFLEFVNYHNIEQLLKDYQIILESSWSGYCIRDILYFTKFNDPIFILTPQDDDFNFIKTLNSNLIPIKKGAGDWVNPHISEPYLGAEKKYDIVMNSSWTVFKRHKVFFKALRQLPQDLKIALVGMSWGNKSVQNIKDLASYYGITQNIDYYENLPYHEALKMVCGSRLSLLVSIKEGCNRAIAESLFCDVPVIVMKKHIGGVVAKVNKYNGIKTDDGRLAKDIQYILNNEVDYCPRLWALNNISCYKSTEFINDFLKRYNLSVGMEWTHDMVVKASSPEMRYINEKDEKELSDCFKDLHNAKI